MGWTKWRKLAEGKQWHDDIFDWDGPACYELGLAGPRTGKLEIMYVGETDNEKRRMAQYGSYGSHIKKEINKGIRDGWILWYRAQAFDTKKKAKAFQDSLLGKYNYPWNIIDNIEK